MKLPSHISKLRPLATSLAKKPQVRRILPAVVAAAVVIAVVVFQAIASTPADTNPRDVESYKKALQGQVTEGNGAPSNGRDPSTQQQTSLASAASQPSGVGQRTDTPAADVTGDHNHDTQPNDVYGDSKKTGIGTNGCYIDYGIQGEQCLPAHAAMGGELTCDNVRSHDFPHGIKVTGTDRFHLDTNHDGTACGHNE